MSSNDNLIKNTDSSALKNLQEFNGNSTNPYLTGLSSGKAYLFITKPQLFLNPVKPSSGSDSKSVLAYQNMCRDSFFSSFLNTEVMNSLDKEIVNQLSYDTDLYNSNFLKLFTNEFKSFTPMDLTLETTDHFETKQGYRMPLPTHTTVSESTGQFSIPVNETNNLDFTKMITLWVRYIKYVTDGTFNANPDMVSSGQLDYMSSAYYFLLGEDGSTIKFWSKYTGVYPNAVPSGVFSYNKGSGEQIQLDIPFTYVSKEDMNPRILEDFNRVSLNDLTFVSDYDDADLDYEPITSSEILNMNSLVNGKYSSTVLSDYRDPLVVYIESTSSITATANSAFHLSFSSSTIDESYINSLVEGTNEWNYMYKTKLEDGDY